MEHLFRPSIYFEPTEQEIVNRAATLPFDDAALTPEAEAEVDRITRDAPEGINFLADDVIEKIALAVNETRAATRHVTADQVGDFITQKSRNLALITGHQPRQSDLDEFITRNSSSLGKRSATGENLQAQSFKRLHVSVARPERRDQTGGSSREDEQARELQAAAGVAMERPRRYKRGAAPARATLAAIERAEAMGAETPRRRRESIHEETGVAMDTLRKRQLGTAPARATRDDMERARAMDAEIPGRRRESIHEETGVSMHALSQHGLGTVRARAPKAAMERARAMDKEIPRRQRASIHEETRVAINTLNQYRLGAVDPGT